MIMSASFNFNLNGDSDNEDIIDEHSEVNKESSQNYQNEQNIEVLSASNVTDLMKETLTSVQEIMCIPITTLRLLLNFYKWDTAKMLETFYTDGQEEMFKRAGLKPISQENTTSNLSSECEICCLSSSDEISLSCGHGFCLSCWEEYFTSQIVEQGVSQQMECPGAGCHTYVEDQFVEKIISNPNVLDKYKLLITDKFVAYNSELAWCPSPQCSKAVKVEVSLPMAVECSCSCRFCFRCGQNDHDTVPCRLINMWDKMVDNGNYFDEVLTRDCPGCGRTIERDGGCNSIKCIKCKTEFCWWCLESHNNHDIAVCSKHTVTETEAAILARKQSKERFNALVQRKQILEEAVGYCVLAEKSHLPPFPKAVHHSVEDLAGRLAAQQVRERNNNVGWLRRLRGDLNPQYEMEALLEDDFLGANHGFRIRRMALGEDRRRMAFRDEGEDFKSSRRETRQFSTVLEEIKSKINIGCYALHSLEKANGIMIKAQKTLGNMQVFANFLPSGPNTEVFEMNLVQLEEAVSRISASLLDVQYKVQVNLSKEILEAVDKRELEDASSFCENRRISLLELVKDGPDASGWIFTK